MQNRDYEILAIESGLEEFVRPGRNEPWYWHRSLDVVYAADAAILSGRLAQPLAAWARRLGKPFRPELAYLCSHGIAYVAPWLTSAELTAAARTVLWVFTIDAATDEPTDPTAIQEQLARRRCVARGAPPSPHDPIAVALSQIRRLVAESRWGPDLLSHWEEAADSSLTGTEFKFDAAQRIAVGGPVPALRDYLPHPTGSIGFDLIALALWANMADPNLPIAIDMLRQPLADASAALRAANDLRGYNRERSKGTIDALALGMSSEELANRMSDHLGDCCRRLEPLISAGFGPAIATERQLLWCVRYYQHTDPGHDSEPAAG